MDPRYGGVSSFFGRVKLASKLEGVSGTLFSAGSGLRETGAQARFPWCSGPIGNPLLLDNAELILSAGSRLKEKCGTGGGLPGCGFERRAFQGITWYSTWAIIWPVALNT